jgi:tartrate dehydrogenase/decarboxylase/D-malate dehydrogenase
MATEGESPPTRLRIAFLPGDGIGREVTAEAMRLLNAIAKLDPSVSFEMTSFPWNSERYLRTGTMMPENGLESLSQFDAIFLGAIGDHRVPDHIALRQLIFAIRQGFDQYINLRPVRLLRGGRTPLAGRQSRDVDILFVRENSEGEYCGVGATLYSETDAEVALQTSVFSRRGVERVMRYAFELARSTGRPLQSVSKGNALNFSGVLWDKIFDELSAEYPDVDAENLLVDAAALHLVLNPRRFGVVVASNLFGDILTDVGAALIGGLGFAASANLCPDRRYPSMFEPVHGSAPDIAGQGIANPVAAFLAAGMMLTDLGLPWWEDVIGRSVEEVLAAGEVRTRDLGGSSSTKQMADAILEKVSRTRTSSRG